MRMGRPQQQSDVIRHLAHELPSRSPGDVPPVPDSSERGPSRVGDTTQHLEVRVLPRDTSVSLVVVDDALGVLGMDVDTELC